MAGRRIALGITTLVVAGQLAACAPPPAKLGAVSLAPNALVDSTGVTVRIYMAAPPEQAAARLLHALVERDLPVTSNQGGVLEAKLPREVGLFAQHEITVRAYVLPDEARGGSAILLYGEETSYSNLSAPIVTRIGRHNQGRALATWRKLVAIGQALGAAP